MDRSDKIAIGLALLAGVAVVVSAGLGDEKVKKDACAKEWAAFENKYDGTCMVQIAGKWVPASNVNFTIMGIAK